MTKTIRLLLAVVVACLACATARAQTDSTARADAPVVSLITCYPGENIYELYGHTQLRVRGTGYDWVFNYGTFDFRAPNFIYRFVKGETD